jgi:hypothetical protein
MNEPKTTIDRRFSDTDAVATGWDETRRLLAHSRAVLDRRAPCRCLLNCTLGTEGRE